MKAIVVEKIGSFNITDRPSKAPDNSEVLIKVAVTGLCRTDLKIIEKGHRDLVLPRIPGEEVVGTVHAIGPGADPKLINSRVYVYPGTSCGHCSQCMTDAGNLCKSMQIMGFHRDGGFAEYVTVPEQCLIPIPQALTFDQAVFAEPLSCCLNALQLSNLKPRESICIWGAGPAGTLLARAARSMGALVTVVEQDKRRLNLANAEKYSEGKLFDVCIVAVGSDSAYNKALSCLGPRGRLVLFSGLSPEQDQITLSFNQLHYNEQTLVGAYGCSYRHGKEALDYIASGSVEVKDMISHQLQLEELDKGLDIVRQRKGMKVLLYP